MVNRGNYRKMKEEENSLCWYCQAKTNSVLIFKNGDEIWACKKCALIHGKVKRLKNNLSQDKSLILDSNSHIKNTEIINLDHSQSAKRPKGEVESLRYNSSPSDFKTALEIEQGEAR